MEEVWKDIEDYEGIYQISNFGRVRRLDGYTSNGKKWKGRVLKNKVQSMPHCPSYLRAYISLHYNLGDGSGKGSHNYTIARLVAKAFLPNPDNLPEVNHKDENPLNNKVDNLEWCDKKYNNNYGNRNNKIRLKNKGKNTPYLEKPVLQYSLDGTFIAEYKSVTEAALKVGGSKKSKYAIHNMLHNKSRKALGYVWKYK